jgi:CHAT domain-containing protein
MLADDEALTLREIMGLRLWRMRLCFLSACETGIVGVDIPNEVVSLPVGRIQAGAAGAVASMWPVHDTTAAVLAAAFYRRWPTQDSDPAVALRDPQSWLRRATTTQVDELLVGLLPNRERAELVPPTDPHRPSAPLPTLSTGRPSPTSGRDSGLVRSRVGLRQARSRRRDW